MRGNDAVEADWPGRAPKAFRLFRAGTNPSDIGPVFVDDLAIAMVLTRQEERGNRYTLDLNHSALDNDARPIDQRSMGSFRLEARNGELWAVDLKWTPEGRQLVESGAFPTISPAFDWEPDTGRITSLFNVALVTTPATHRATELIAAARPNTGMGTTMNTNRTKIEQLKSKIALARKMGIVGERTYVVQRGASTQFGVRLSADEIALMRLTEPTAVVTPVGGR